MRTDERVSQSVSAVSRTRVAVKALSICSKLKNPYLLSLKRLGLLPNERGMGGGSGRLMEVLDKSV